MTANWEVLDLEHQLGENNGDIFLSNISVWRNPPPATESFERRTFEALGRPP
jgi:hypothetical protein